MELTQDVIEAEALIRAQRGFDRLMQEDPSGAWLDRVNPVQLNILHVYDCVLGQVYGHYENGLSRLWPEQYGDGLGLTGELFKLSAKHGFTSESRIKIMPPHMDTAWRALLIPAKAERASAASASRLAEGTGREGSTDEPHTSAARADGAHRARSDRYL
jgi:hypothetical protein